MRYLLLVLIFICSVTSFSQMKSIVRNPQRRELRYTPEGDGFVIENGHEKFNKALYGTNTSFRVETSDRPEFGLFMPNMGGNIQLGLLVNDKSIWLNSANYIKSTYISGSRSYEIKDPLIGKGVIQLTVLALADADGMIMKVESMDLPSDVELLVMYGGASNKRFSRNGDLGVDKPDCFDLKVEACKGNDFAIAKNRFVLHYGQTTKHPRSVEGVFPKKTLIKTGSPLHIASPFAVWNSEPEDDQPVLTAKVKLKSSQVDYVVFKKNDEEKERNVNLQQWFAQAENKRVKIAQTVQIETPDQYITPLGGLIGTAADAIWDDCWMHGAIGWRMPLNGWRAGYTGDCIGWHDRARTHFDNYAASQVTEVDALIAHPAQDTARHFARAAKIWGTSMYSNGYICRNPNQNTKMHHYDMNQCYIDELLWHLNWTGDWDYAKKIWPVIERHLKWEKSNFDPNNDGLYDAYASIWASDALYYNSGAVTHASAYNYRANKMAAIIASGIGEDPKPYALEAEKILQAIQSNLWLAPLGRWAEYIDFMGPGNVHPDAAIWTVYHAIDSEVHDIFQAYQATRYVDTEIPHIPVQADGLDKDTYAIISTTHWFPYSWSINNVAFAEVAHTALAYWQAGRNESAYHLFKSAVLDGMYLGASPGNIGQISYFDKARGECYRDFGDPVGMYSRTLIQGLYGIQPDLLNNTLVIKPGFPSDWDYANLETSDIQFRFSRTDNLSTYHIATSLADKLTLELNIKAEQSAIKQVLINGKLSDWILTESVGTPMVRIKCELQSSADVKIEWSGSEIQHLNYTTSGAVANSWQVSSTNTLLKVYDPQDMLNNELIRSNSLTGVLSGEVGHHTFFVEMEQDEMKWWEPVNIEIKEPFDIEYSSEESHLKFRVYNNQNKPFKGQFILNPGTSEYQQNIVLAADAKSAWFEVPAEKSVFGSNLLKIRDEDQVFQSHLVNWTIPNGSGEYAMVPLDSYLNASVSDIFEQEYLTPRSPYTTLQIPTQGIGEWCHPLHTAVIDDKGFRSVVKDEVFTTPFEIPFRSTSDTTKQNIIYTSLWDNYPDKVEIPLEGNARHAYLLMAGSTNHMQCHIPNGKVVVTYIDGSCDTLNLVNPNNWLPIEQDLYTDEYAFKLDRPVPYRVAFKSGEVSRDLGKVMGIDPDEVYGREIDGGAGIVVDMPLQVSKELKKISIESTANDVVIGLMSLTLMK